MGKSLKQWENAVMVHKKGDCTGLNTYFLIILFSVLYKQYSKITISRITEVLESIRPREQASFRSGFLTTGYVYAVNQIIEEKRLNATNHCVWRSLL